MAIPKLKKQDVIDALKFIDENGVPEHNTSVKYVLVSEDGKKYPPKYVVAVADHLANSTDISTESFNSVDAKNYLKSLGFSIETKQQEKFELSITAESVESTDERFTMDNLSLGDNYKPLDAYFKRANGDVIKRAYSKGERRNSNQTLPRIACQVFEKQLAALSVEDKENFPVCKYNPGSDVIRGIYASVDDFKNRRNTIEYLTYGYDNGRQFVIYCWNIFSTIIFVQECLKRFGEPGDQFILTYREKDEKETAAAETEAAVQEELTPDKLKGYYRRFFNRVVDKPSLLFIFTVTCVYTQPCYQAENEVLKFHMQEAFQRIQMDTRPDGFATMIMDELNQDKVKQLKDACHRMMVEGDFVKYENVYHGVLTECSSQSTGIQLADYAVGIMNCYLRKHLMSRGDYTFATDLYTEFVLPHLRKHANGTIVGYGVREVPSDSSIRQVLIPLFN